METTAVQMHRPGQISLGPLALTDPVDGEVIVETRWSGISTGTERLLWSGKMPSFPGMGYPLVPGYESVGEVVEASPASRLAIGQKVFVPGAKCFGDVRGLFGASASRLVVAAERIVPIDASLDDKGILLALAATAYHALAVPGAQAPDCIVGHGVLGRMLARLAIARGAPPPTVWETDTRRMSGGADYQVLHPDADPRRDYRAIYDASGDSALLDTLIGRLAPGGEIVLAGFYDAPISFAFPPAFMREARLRIAAQWLPQDLIATRELVESGKLSLDGLITHRAPADDAANAYPIAFTDPSCLKMALNWSARA
jgi:3-hydroxyethyl bacteriochlorophyllide a dehydrogenase